MGVIGGRDTAGAIGGQASTGPPCSRTTYDRLIDAVTEVAARDGYARLTVERLLATAGVSRATFYQYFENVQDCFWNAYRDHAERLLHEVGCRVAGKKRPDLAALGVLVDLARTRPRIARMLMIEGLAAGAAGAVERDALLAGLESAVGSSAGEPCIDLPSATLHGGIFRFLSIRLLQEGDRHDLDEEVQQWAHAFARRPSETAWGVRFAAPLPAESALASPLPGAARRHESARERILHATAASVRERGYHSATVANIATAARVSRRRFYDEFPSKEAAFTATYEHGFRRTIAACAPEFFAAMEWPERVWRATEAFARFFAREPLLAHLGFVECYAAGPEFAARAHDIQLAFTLFLEDGYRQRLTAPSPSRSCGALAAATIFEVGFQAARRAPALHIQRMQPLVVFIALTPFIGRDRAARFVTAKLAQAGSGS